MVWCEKCKRSENRMLTERSSCGKTETETGTRMRNIRRIKSLSIFFYKYQGRSLLCDFFVSVLNRLVFCDFIISTTAFSCSEASCVKDLKLTLLLLREKFLKKL